ncbi:MAG: alpha-amylase family glycosyl hydrolase [Planctomycetota bacterium]
MTLLLLASTTAVLVALRLALGDARTASAWLELDPVDLDAGEPVGLPSSVVAERIGADADRFRVTFSLSADHEGETCAVAGDFNAWSHESAPMQRTGDGRWVGEVVLGPGVHRYKFCLDGDRWLPDPESDEREDDGFSSENSILRLGTVWCRDGVAEERADNHVFGAGLEHDPGVATYVHRIGSPERLRMRYRTLAGDVDSVSLAVRDAEPVPMAPIQSPAPFQYWQVDLPLPDGAIEYSFALRSGDTTVRDPRAFHLVPRELPKLETPAWAKDAIWYQIFPERFRNGDPSNDPEHCRAWTSDWNEAAPFEGQDGQTFWEFYVYQRMYGGDLAGIEQGLDHLEELGVTALYLNPVFHAEGPHKYNATDFRHIDTRFGAGEEFEEATRDEVLEDPSTWVWTPSDRLFLDFLKSVKARGFRVVLDAVFNHVGVAHPAFRDVAARGEESPYSDWFAVRSYEPFEYHGWAGFGELPVFAKTDHGFVSDGVRDHVFAVTRRWMDPDGDGDPSDGIDGWRLDVPAEVPRGFWEEWRSLVKSINPDAYVAGEVWTRADAWLDGRTFDAVMNYRFAEPVLAWIGNVERRISTTELDERLLELRIAYPAEASFAMMNLVNSHDTDRLVTMLANPDRPYDRSNQTQREDDFHVARPPTECFEKARLVALFQATYVGAPMVYYGDEVGMWGADDPTNRQPMVWRDLGAYDDPDVYFLDEHFEHYRAIVALRRTYAALRRGSFRTLECDDEGRVYAFERVLGDERVVVALNAGDEAAPFSPGAGLHAVLGEGDGPIPPRSGRVWATSPRSA